MKLEIEISDQIFNVIKRFAWANRLTVEEYCQDKFKFEEKASTDPEKIASYEEMIDRRRADKLMRKWHGEHKTKRYRMKDFRDGSRLVLSWIPSRLPAEVDRQITHKGHAGEYYANLQKEKDSEIVKGGLGITTVLKSEPRYFKTMKAMKKFINRHFDKHGYKGYYNVKAQAKKKSAASGEGQAEG